MTDVATTNHADFPSVAWIASGKLHVKKPNKPMESIESTFARETIERRIRQEQHDGWKGRSGVWGNMGMAPPTWSQWDQAESRQQIRFSTLARGNSASQLFYVLDLGGVGGLFRYDPDAGTEPRLMHREGFATPDLSRRPGSGEVAVTLQREGGTRGIAIGENDGRLLKAITVSDGHDEVPAWVEDGSPKIIYQSSEFQRDDDGVSQAQSTYRIEMIDLDTQGISVVHEQSEVDLLQPRMLKDGTLFFVRRPFRAGPAPRHFVDDLKDVLLFPWRLGVAVLHFLNFFSTMFAGKPLVTGLGDRSRSANEPRQLMLWGHMIDTRRALSQAAKRQEPARLVPSDWELVRREPSGEEAVLANHVLTFDVNSVGDIVYTDGSRVQLIRDDQTSTIVTDTFVEKVAILD